MNLGCGRDPWGDVRVDVDDYGRPDVICDAVHLPFREHVFSEVRAFHVLEHFKNPLLAVQEAKRVGQTVHAKFPYKYDRIPFVLNMLFSGNRTAARQAIHDVFWHVMTQLGFSDHPIAHRWLIQPMGSCRLNRVNVAPWQLLRFGRKGKIFRRFPDFMMNAEWECLF